MKRIVGLSASTAKQEFMYRMKSVFVVAGMVSAFALFFGVPVASAAVLTPTAVESNSPDGNNFGLPQYGAARTIDSDAFTFVVFYDDTPFDPVGGLATGDVTGHVVYDLGAQYAVGSVTLTARNAGPGEHLFPKSVDVFYYNDDTPENHVIRDDVGSDPGIVAAWSGTLNNVVDGASQMVTFASNIPASRYVGIRFNSSWASDYPLTYGADQPVQFAEVTFDDAPVPDQSVPRIWGSNQSGDWNTSSNWSPSLVPNGDVAPVVFGSAINSAATVFTNSSVTAKQIMFDNVNSYAIAGTGSVNLQADTGNASLNVVQGTHEFQARVNLLSNTDGNVAAAATLEFNNRFSLGGNTLTKTGDGTLKINNDLNTGGGSIVVLGGSVGGGGSIPGDLANTGGTVAPGNSPGKLSVQGNFSQAAGGTLSVELAGLAAGTQYDQLAVTGNATLNGTLAVTLLNGFAPSLGDTFSVLTYGSHSGTFSSTTGTTLGGHLALRPTYGSTSLLLTARPAQDGDINLDGVVNIFDINSVSSNWNSAGPQGDANGDSIVNIFDINLISSNWGATGGGGTAVPEPSCFVLAVLGLVGIVPMLRKQRLS